MKLKGRVLFSGPGHDMVIDKLSTIVAVHPQ